LPYENFFFAVVPVTEKALSSVSRSLKVNTIIRNRKDTPKTAHVVFQFQAYKAA
jgi:hypothetical protein